MPLDTNALAALVGAVFFLVGLLGSISSAVLVSYAIIAGRREDHGGNLGNYLMLVSGMLMAAHITVNIAFDGFFLMQTALHGGY